METTLVPEKDGANEVQFPMPGMPSPLPVGTIAGAEHLRAGQVVFYSGSLPGGPRRGARGVVKRALGRQAVVDLENLGIWYIPYYYLTAPSKAA